MGSFNLFSSVVNITLVYLISVTLYKSITCYETYYVEEMCSNGILSISVTHNGSSSSGVLRATRHTSYSLQMSCKIQIVSPAHYGIIVSLREVGFRTNLDGSCKDYLKIFGAQLNEEIDPVVCQRVRNLDESRSYVSKFVNEESPNVFELTYQTGSDLNNKSMTGYSGFTLTFTAYKPTSASNPCQSKDEFRCDNARCIWSGLLCDGHNNCGDLSDEKTYGSSACGYIGGGSFTLIILGVLIVILGFVSALVTLVCYQERRRKRRSTMLLRRKTESLVPIIQVIENPRHEQRPRRSSGKKPQLQDDGFKYQTFENTDSSPSSSTNNTSKKYPTEMKVVPETRAAL